MGAINRVLLVGLDSVPPELAFGALEGEMPTLTQLRREGAWGPLESVIPPITVPAWACMLTGRTPGELGLYGFRNRCDFSYDGLAIATSRDVRAPALWDLLAKEGKRSIVVGVPPGYPPRPVRGLWVSCFLTPGPDSPSTQPPELQDKLKRWVAPDPLRFDVEGFRTDDKARLKREIFQLTAQRFLIVKRLMAEEPWDLLAFVDIGPDRLHHGFWKHWDPAHPRHDPKSPFKGVIPEYYRFLDEQLRRLLEAVPDDAAVLIVSDHGAQRLEGGFCLNEWLRLRGFLCLKPEAERAIGRSERPIPLTPELVDWACTVAWGEGGYYGRIFLNVRGREPRGVVAQSDYERVRDELIERLEREGPTGTRVHRPEALYPRVEGIAPDLIALFGGLRWRAVGSLGHPALLVQENDTGPDDANHSMRGIVVAWNVPGLQGELRGAKLLDVFPTLLELFGLPSPNAPKLQGRPLVERAGRA